jgi:histidine triad (HIT) family protein
MAKAKAGPCLFCQIERGELPAHVVYQDKHCLAFLDHRPLFPGHVLLIPRAHFQTLPELPPELIEPLFGVSQKIASAVENVMQAEGTFVAMNNRVSQSVPHLHIHIVPRRKKDGLKGFFRPRHPYTSSDEMVSVRDTLKAALGA